MTYVGIPRALTSDRKRNGLERRRIFCPSEWRNIFLSILGLAEEGYRSGNRRQLAGRNWHSGKGLAFGG
jgi:hypothetical protein